MKKFFGIIAIAGTLVACDNAGNGTSVEDSTKRAQDSIRREDSIRNATTPITPMPDSLNNTGSDTGTNRTGTDTSGRQ